MNLTHLIWGEIVHFHELAHTLSWFENMIRKRKNMFTFCVLQLFHVNLAMRSAKSNAQMKQEVHETRD